jgi:RNA polymerase sigma-70 factor (ECF subfamily)
MDRDLDYRTLVEKAKAGDRLCLNELASMARERLRTYVYRLTQQEDLSQEIVQESLLEMCRVLGKLKDNERFWSWLYGIATNKLHRHYRTEKARRNAAALEQVRRESTLERQAGFENLVGAELKAIISRAMLKLRTRHKAVLVMRCYDDMSYAEIAESMGCSEFSSRMLFVRAKRALQKELSHSGLGKGSLLGALIVFGKMTAPSEAAAAQLTVPAAATKVGLVAGLVGAATTKTAVVTLTTAGILAVGTVATKSHFATKNPDRAVEPALLSQAVSPLGTSQIAHEKYMYYFPQGPEGPVMVRAELTARAGQAPRQILQNDQANYSYEDNTLTINNYRMWQDDLSVLRLPTDPRELTSFLTMVEGKSSNVRPVSAQGKGLLVVVERDQADTDASLVTDPKASAARPWAVRHFNVLDEGYFQSDFSVGTVTVDRRDIMHTRGWTYFTVSGRVGDQTISGAGCIPFTYAASKEHSPWLKVQVGDRLTVQDSRLGATLRDAQGSVTVRYSQGSFFKGLSRPWMGLHSLDTVRRDAAEKRMRFETEPAENGRDVRVTVRKDQVDLTYTIDLEADTVTQIEFVRAGVPIGRLEFKYLQDLKGDLSVFQPPSGTRERTTPREGPGMLWLVGLAEDR